MPAVLQLQPIDDTPGEGRNVISLDPARRSRIAREAGARAAEARPVRARSLAIALAVGALIGALVSLNAVDADSPIPLGADIKSEEVVAP